MITADVRSAIAAGVDYLVRQQQRDYPEAVHYLTLPCMSAPGKISYETWSTGFFQRMLILDALLDARKELDLAKVTKRLIEVEVEKILRSKHPNVAGGWSYIPDLALLPPDADDLGYVLQILSRTGGKELASVCDGALDLLFSHNSHEDGSFETWVLEPGDEGVRPLMRDYVKVVGGTGPSPDVVSNLLLGLALYDKSSYAAQLRQGVKYLTGRQEKNGCWQSKWYWGEYYATWKVLAVLHAVAETGRTVAAARRFLLGSQKSDGGWGGEKSDPLNTAFALLALRPELPSHEGIARGVGLLLTTQSSDGAWDRAPFIRMATQDGPLTYESRSATTAFCIKALVFHLSHAGVPQKVAIPFVASSFPYRRDTEGFSLLSNDRWQWALLKDQTLLSQNRKELQREEVSRQRPSLHIIEMARECNLACSYCSVSAAPVSPKNRRYNKGELDAVARFIVDAAADSFCVEFQGGEPLLNFGGIRHAVATIREYAGRVGKRPAFRLVSNLSLLDPEITSYLRCHAFDVSTSLDGPEELHNRHRKSGSERNSYRKAIQGIHCLRSAGVPVGVLSVITRDSLELPEAMAAHFAQLNLLHVVFNPVTHAGRARTGWDALKIEAHEYGRFWKRFSRACFTFHAKGVPLRDRILEHLIEKLIWAENPHFVDHDSPCGCIFGQIAYDLEGNIYPCDEGRFNGKICLGQVGKTSFSQLAQTEQAADLVAASVTSEAACKKCAYRPFCGRCPVKNIFEAGAANAPSENMSYCGLWKSLFDAFFELAVEEHDALLRASAIIRKDRLFRSPPAAPLPEPGLFPVSWEQTVDGQTASDV